MSEDKPIRILITDDHAVVREGLQALIASEPGMEVVGEAQDGVEAVMQARLLQPDVVLLDLVMPRMGGLEAIGEIKQENPDARILILTSFAEDDKVFPAVRAGALGYLLKDSGPEELVQAIRQVYRGESSLHPSIARRVLQELVNPSEQGPNTNALTEREVEVLQLVAGGQSNRDISNRLAISEATVRTHVSNILSKLNLGSRTQAALYALREGLASLYDADAPVQA